MRHAMYNDFQSIQTEQAKAAMDYGTRMEKNAIATLTNVIMPVQEFCSNLVYVEEGEN